MRIIINYFLFLSTRTSKVLYGGFSSLENNSSNLYKFIIDRFNYILIRYSNKSFIISNWSTGFDEKKILFKSCVHKMVSINNIMVKKAKTKI